MFQNEAEMYQMYQSVHISGLISPCLPKVSCSCSPMKESDLELGVCEFDPHLEFKIFPLISGDQILFTSLIV